MKLRLFIYAFSIVIISLQLSCNCQRTYSSYLDPQAIAKEYLSKLTASDTTLIFSTTHSVGQISAAYIFCKKGQFTRMIGITEYGKYRETDVYFDWKFLIDNLDGIRQENINDYSEVFLDSTGKTLYKEIITNAANSVKILTAGDTVYKSIMNEALGTNRDKLTYKVIQMIRSDLFGTRFVIAEYKTKRKYGKGKLINK